MSSKKEIFDKSVNKFDKKLNSIDKLLKNKITLFMKDLEVEDGNILSNDANMQKVLLFQKQMEKDLLTGGYQDFINEFVAEVPDIIKEL